MDGTASKQWQQARAVELAASWLLEPCRRQHRRKHIAADHRHAALRARLDFPGPADDSRHPVPALVHRPFAAAQSSSQATARALVAVAFGTIVTGEEDQRGISKLHVVQRLHELPEGVVELRDVRAVGPLLPIGDAGMELLITLFRRDRIVRLVRPDGQEERLLWVAFLLEPADSLLRDERRRIVIGLADGLAIADEVRRKRMARCGVVLRGEPPGVAVIGWLRLVG